MRIVNIYLIRGEKLLKEDKSVFRVNCWIFIDLNAIFIKSKSDNAINNCIIMEIEICECFLFNPSIILSFALTNS